MIYKVRVRCIGEQGDIGKKKNLVRCVMEALIEVDDRDDAIADGLRHVGDHAPVDVRWKEFNFMSAAPVAFPILVKDI